MRGTTLRYIACAGCPGTFLSTYPVRGTTGRTGQSRQQHRDFYPRTPCGVRQATSRLRRALLLFLSTYPVRGTTTPISERMVKYYYFYPRTPCGVRRAVQRRHFRGQRISIHVPRAGYDRRISRNAKAGKISIHVPRAGYDMVPTMMPSSLSAFLSTYPVRGTTRAIAASA